LYERHASRVYRYCYYRLRSAPDAEDAVQTTFLYAFRGLRRGVSPRLEVPWLLAIAKNVCRSRWEAARRRGCFETTRDPELLQETAASDQPSQDELIRLREALAGLTEQQRRAILLREWQGLSYEEIATKLGLSLAAVETLIFRARRALADGLNGAPVKPQSRRVRALDGVSLLAGLKSVLGGGTAVKAGAAAIAATTALTLFAASSPEWDARSVRQTISQRPASIRTPDALSSAAALMRLPSTPIHAGGQSAEESGSAPGAPPAAEGGTSAETGDPVSEAVGGLTDAVDDVTDATAPVVDTLTDTTDEVVGSVGATADALVDGLPKSDVVNGLLP
jgi:RNA polymerase sigma-70 factor (ECF subfamily)